MNSWQELVNFSEELISGDGPEGNLYSRHHKESVARFVQKIGHKGKVADVPKNPDNSFDKYTHKSGIVLNKPVDLESLGYTQSPGASTSLHEMGTVKNYYNQSRENGLPNNLEHHRMFDPESGGNKHYYVLANPKSKSY